MKRLSLTTALVASLGTCAPPSTEVVLRVTTDMAQGECDGLAGLRIAVSSDASASNVSRVFELGARHPGALFLPQEIGIVPDGGGAGQRLTVDVTARGPDGDLFTRRATLSYATGRTALLEVFLAERCRNRDARRCATGTTCGATGCEPEARASLDDYRPMPPDAPAAPRLLTPRSGGVLTSAIATLRWTAPRDGGTFRVELCADRACTRALRSPVVTAGHCARISRGDVRPGAAFWRVTGVTSGRSSATWAFFVGARDAITASASRTSLDLDGDGRSDVASAPTAGGALRVYAGGARESLADRVATVDAPSDAPQGYGRVASIGDFDGDGFADLAAASPLGDAATDAHLDVLLGGPRGVSSSRRLALAAPIEGGFTESGAEALSIAGAGDVDGDGFADLLVGAPHAQRVFVFHGGGDARPRASVLTPPPDVRSFGAVAAGAGDVDGDGYDDVLVGGLTAGTRARWLYVLPGGFGGPSTARRVELQPGDGGAALGAQAEAVSAGDINGDGSGDLVVRGADVGVYLGPAFLGGPLSPQHSVRFATGVSVLSVGAGGDLDGDGFGEVLVVARGATGRAGVFVEYGSATPGAASMTEVRQRTVDLGPGGAWSAVGVGDLDGDLRDDFIAFDAASNGSDVRVFYGDATGFVEGPSMAVEGGVSLAR